jgi:CRP-like cAMP-binding protein
MATTTGKDVIKDRLRVVPLFADLSTAEIDALAAGSRAFGVRKNTRVLEEGTPADSCLVLASGRAKVLLSGDNGTEILLAVIRPTTLVGEVALLDRSTRTASLVAIEPCQFIRIPAPAFEQLRTNPRFEHKMVSRVASMVREANDQLRGISTFPAVSRVAWSLGRIARQEGSRDGNTVVIPKIAHHTLAEMTGCSRETVSRALSTLKRQKYVSWDRKTMRLEINVLQRVRDGETGTTADWAYNLGALGLG